MPTGEIATGWLLHPDLLCVCARVCLCVRMHICVRMHVCAGMHLCTCVCVCAVPVVVCVHASVCVPGMGRAVRIKEECKATIALLCVSTCTQGTLTSSHSWPLCPGLCGTCQGSDHPLTGQ